MSEPRIPGVLFLCTHNAGRSQMASGFTRTLGAEHIRVFSGGSEPASQVNPSAVEVMREVGIDIANFVPQKWSMEMLHEVDVVVTMGCGDTCPYIPGKRYVDWPLDDPAGQGVDAVRPIRDQIKTLVDSLLEELGVR
jgi:protein-tyrosine-phosphatase